MYKKEVIFLIKHIILWTFNTDFNEAEKGIIVENAKKELEDLPNQIDGLIDLKVHINKLPSSNADMMLESTFTDESALNEYQKNPIHIKIADRFVRPFIDSRLCFDFKV